MKTKTIFLALIFLGIFGVAEGTWAGDSELFPPYENAPALTSYVSGGVFAHTYYVSPTGNDATGNGTLGNPWASVAGAASGGIGTAATAGDIIYFRGGLYLYTADKIFNIDGNIVNRIVFTAYPGETPVIAATGDYIDAVQIAGDYVVVDGLTFSSGSLRTFNSQQVTIQNCIFDGDPYDPPGDQMNDFHLWVSRYSDYTVIRNCYFDSYNAHSIKTYPLTSRSAIGTPKNLRIIYNRFHTGEVSFGVITFKAAITDYEIAYNRFENLTAKAITIGTSYEGEHNGLNIHHNVFDNCANSIIEKLTQSIIEKSQVLNFSFHDNVIYNATSGNRDVLELDCDENPCIVGATTALGEVYNNVMYGIVDAIDPETTTEFINYPNYWNYNAYSSTAFRDTAENQNNLPASSWQDSSVIAVDHGIARTGVAGDRFYSISDSSPFKGAGRYGDNIGGFVFSDTDTNAPIVTNFVIPSTASSLTVTITALTAIDTVGVTGYMVTESATAPAAGAVGWTTSVPASYTFSTAGSKTLYAWAKDAAGNVSTSLNDSVEITLDTIPPSAPSGLLVA